MKFMHGIGSYCRLLSYNAGRSISLLAMLSEESDPAVLRNRQHVYKEMVDTETVFIDDLKIILDVSQPLVTIPSLCSSLRPLELLL